MYIIIDFQQVQNKCVDKSHSIIGVAVSFIHLIRVTGILKWKMI